MSRRPVLLIVVSLLALTGCKQKISPEETAAHLKAAQNLYASKNYAQALVEVQGAIKGDPRSGDAHYLAAQIQEGLKDPRAAFEEYARAAAPDANNMKAQLKVAEMLIDAKQLDAALGRLNGTLGSHPNDPDALALKALAEQRQGSADKARADAQASLARSPGQPIATAVVATDALVSKNADKALQLIATGLKAHPDDPILVRLKAVALVTQDKKDDAIALFQGLTAEKPTSVRDQMALAELEAQAGRIDNGERVLRDAVAATPDSNDMRLALVAFLARHRNEAAADTELKAGIAAHPQDTAFDLLRAGQLARAGQLDQASEALRIAVDRVPEGPAKQAAEVALARMDIDQGHAPEARKLLDTVLAAKADNDDALLLRATLMTRDNDAAHAIPDLLAVVGRRPRNAAAFTALADAYLQQGDLEKGTDALKKVAYFDPTNILAALRLADVNLKAKKPDQAKAAIAEYVTRNPDKIEGRVALVRFALQQKDWGGAQAAIDAMRSVPRADRTQALLGAELAEAKGQPDVAMTAYAKLLPSIAGQPLDRNALVGYARSAVAANKAAAAVGTLTGLAGRSTALDAASVDLTLAALYRANNQNDQAIASANAAIAVAPKEAGGYVELAGAQAKAQPAEAIATLSRGIAAGAPAEPLLMVRATLQDQNGDKEGALASYREVLKANPGAAIAGNNYASLVTDMRPTDKAALSDARASLQRFADTSNPAVLDTLAWLDYRLGNYPSAKSLLVRANAETSQNPQLRYHYGAVLIALGEKDAGRKIVQSAITETFPGHAEAERLVTE